MWRRALLVFTAFAAQTDNGVGVAGIAPNVSIMPIKVLNDSGTGWFRDILDGIDWAGNVSPFPGRGPGPVVIATRLVVRS